MKAFIYFVSIIIFVLPSVYSQEQINAIRIEEPPSIDGHVIESVWDKAFKTDEFYQREPDDGTPA